MALIYMDNAATSFPKPDEVYRAVDHALREVGGNPGRSGHSMAFEANKIIFDAREAVAELLGVDDSSRVVFTSCATESLNLAIKGILRPGVHVVTSSIEHSSVTRPLYKLAGEGIEVTKTGCSCSGIVEPAEIQKAIKANTSLIVITHASNVIGAIEPVREIGAIARKKNIPFLLDASQTAGVVPIDVEEMKVDMLAAPGHKGLLGPQGTGVLYVGEGISLSPLMEGGTGLGSASEDQPASLPDRFEAGTLNTPGIAGLGAGIRFILDKGVGAIRKKESALIQRLMAGLAAIEGLSIYGPKDVDNRASLVTFNIEGLDPALVCSTLDGGYGIMTRAGLHCAPDAHRAIGTFPAGCVRLSPGYFNTFEEIDLAVRSVAEIAAGR